MTLQSDKSLSSFAFNSNAHPYSKVEIERLNALLHQRRLDNDVISKERNKLASETLPEVKALRVQAEVVRREREDDAAAAAAALAAGPDTLSASRLLFSTTLCRAT